MNPISFLRLFLFLLLFSFLAVSCTDDDEAVPLNDGSDATVNQWIHNVMKEAYYWTDELPAQVNYDQPPMTFFETLRNREDSFSVIVPDFDALLKSLDGVYLEAGYEFMLFYVSENSDALEAVVLYVKEGSPAEAKGLKRGDIISKINGRSLNLSNYESLLNGLSSNHSLTYSRLNEVSGYYEEQPSIDLTVVELNENPHFMDTVYNIEGKKIGYYVYNFFSEGVSGKEYDDQMDQIIANFKSEGISELILDLRYNSGGAISSATNLASLIGKNVGSDRLFYENRWNDFYQDYIQSQPDGEATLKRNFTDKGENIGDNLSSGRVYVLTGSRSASASELIINGLRPYMEVYLIGNTTVGKNVGSVPIGDDNNNGHTYGLLPITFKIFNSLGESDYAGGFQPNVYENDFMLPIRPLGDIRENLLATALETITGLEIIEGRVNRSNARTLNPLMFSIDRKAHSNRAVFEKITR